MRFTRSMIALVVLHLPSLVVPAQSVVGQNTGLVNPDHLEHFGRGWYPNGTPVTTQFAGITVGHASYYTTGGLSYLNVAGGYLANDGSGAPDTLQITFAAAIHDVTFVYHQIGPGQPSIFRALRNGTVVGAFALVWNQIQLNNYFGFTNLVIDEIQIDFVGNFRLDELAYNDVPASVTFRNGTGVNPPAFASASLPIVGTTWMATITPTPNTITSFIAIALGGPHTGFPLLNGEALMELSPAPVLIEGYGSFGIAIPNDPSLSGLAVTTQGVRVNGVGPTQVIVLLNALDLLLGVS